MTHQRFSPKSRYVKGFSLIELMISLTIGLIITVAVFSAYIGASGAGRMAEAQGRMNEDAQAALIILSQQLRMAGNNPDQANRTVDSLINPVYSIGEATTPLAPSSFSIRGCDGKFSDITTAANLDGLTCASDTSKPDSIAINYEADIFNTLPASGKPTDCLGNALGVISTSFNHIVPPVDPPIVPAPSPVVSGPYNYSVADNRFYIDTSSSIPSLYCKGNGDNGTSQPLVENIEDMQFLYGATAATAMVAGYLNADEVSTLTTIQAENWKKILTVRICVVVRSEVPVVSEAASARYIKCDGTQENAPPDLRLRRAYSTTVVLRNRLPLKIVKLAAS